MGPKAALGRDRNNLKFSKWGFYITGDAGEEGQTMKRLRATTSIVKGRLPGWPNQALVLEKVAKNKVEIAWPLAVSADAVSRLVRLALGSNWRGLVTDPAGVQGAHQGAETAEEGVEAAGAAGEQSFQDCLEAALFEDAPGSRGAASSAAGPRSPRPPCSGAIASSAATAEAFRGANLLALKLEGVTVLYGSSKGERGQYRALIAPPKILIMPGASAVAAMTPYFLS